MQEFQITIIDTAIRYWPLLLSGFWVTLKLAAIITVVSTVIGTVLALIKMSNFKWASFLVTAYVEIVRGTPPLLQLFIVFYTAPTIGIVLDAEVAAIVALGGYGSAFTCEIVRAGLLGVPVGQLEAGRSLGMKGPSLYRWVILPQAFRLIVPPMTSQVILNLKGTSLALTITVGELMFRAYEGANNTFRPGDFYLLAGILYLCVSIPLSRLAKRFELDNLAGGEAASGGKPKSARARARQRRSVSAASE
jgi:His/Glu/Gln/Arg/opine family amino acid ABC transporter permease subunit